MKYLKETTHVSVDAKVESEDAFADVDETCAGTRRAGHAAIKNTAVSKIGLGFYHLIWKHSVQ